MSAINEQFPCCKSPTWRPACDGTLMFLGSRRIHSLRLLHILSQYCGEMARTSCCDAQHEVHCASPPKAIR
jgi:hypothetical protein